MATIHMDKKFSFLNAEAWSWTPTVATADTLTLEGSVHSLTLHGSFTYEGSDILGLVEDASYAKNGEAIYTITDINRSASLLQGALELVEMTGEPSILLAYIFGGDDSLYGSAGKNVILGYDGDDYIFGSGGDDKLLGGTGNDTIDGGAGDDTIHGGYGSDTLNGGAGDNLIFTGPDADTVVIDNRSDGIDTIEYFESGSDVIQLANGIGAPFKNLGADGALNANFFAANAGGNAVDGDDYVVYDSNTGALYYDADGSGAGAKVQIALLGISDHPAITAADIAVHNI